MSGHSKWSTIKHKKSATDQKRGKLFSVISKAITIATKEGQSGDPTQNPALRLAIDKARAANMPSTNIKRSIDKGLGKGDGGALQEVVYEGYGPGGVGVMVIASTDNRKRTGAEVRFIFEKNGGSLGAPGSAAFLFIRQGSEIQIKVPLPVEDKVKNQIKSLIESLTDQGDVTMVKTNAA